MITAAISRRLRLPLLLTSAITSIIISFSQIYAQSDSSLKTEGQQSIDKVLNDDGTIRTDLPGSYNVSGYSLSYGKNGEPILSKPSSLKKINSSATWNSLGSGRNGTTSTVSAIAVSSTGDVYVGGGFSIAGDIVSRYIVRWSSSTNSWSSLTSGSINGVNGAVYAIVISGNDVYVGGAFTQLGDASTSANYIAKWNSSTNTWSALTSGSSNGVNNTVYAIAVSGSDVYIGGTFTQLGDLSTSANYIAKWNSSTNSWSTLTSGSGNGVNGAVRSMAISSSDVYVGGEFTLLGNGSTSAKYIAKWNSSTNTWSTLPSGGSNGVNYFVRAFAINGSDVYVGGEFTLLGNGSTSAKYIAKWNSSTNTWSTLTSGSSNGVNNFVSAIAVSGNDVYVGGSFSQLGDATTSANYIAKWNSSTNTWSTLTSGISNGVNNTVNAIAISGSDIYAGGTFTQLGDASTSANKIAKWNSSINTWSALPSGGSNGLNGSVNALAISGSEVYVGGSFTQLGDATTSAKYIVKWNTSTNSWSTLPSGSSNGVGGTVNAIVISGSDVYVGGSFTQLGDGSTSANRIAKWNSSTNTWSTLASGGSNGVNNIVNAIAISGSDVYVGGTFTQLGDLSTSANKIAKWNSSTNTWTTLTSGSSNGVNSTVRAIAISGNYVYVGGYFTQLGDGTSAKDIARWNSSTNTWSTITSGASNGLNNAVKVITINGSDVYAGGNFTMLGDGLTSANYIVKWNSTTNTWSPLPSGSGNGVNNYVNAIAVCGNDVYVGGDFTLLGDGTTSANKIAKWNGSSLEALTEGTSTGLNSFISAFAVSTESKQMFAGGGFTALNSNKAGFYIGSFTDTGNPALPVQLTSFSATEQGNRVVLNWTTSNEVDCYGFEIYRKNVGINENQWLKAGFKEGHGNSYTEYSYNFTDNLTSGAGRFYYRLKQLDNNGQFRYYDEISVDVKAPDEFKLMQNSPNPFNPVTAIRFELPVSTLVSVKIYDLTGREVAFLVNEEKPAGSHIVYWNGRDNSGHRVTSGIYLYRLTAGSFTETRKMNFLK